MDIATLSAVNSNIQVCDAANLAVVKMVMNSAKENGENMSQMIKSADPNLGNNIDVRV